MATDESLPCTTTMTTTSSSKHSKRLSRFCFTLNNYTNEEEQVIQMLGTVLKLKWLIYGRETGEQGTPHLQGAAVIGRQLAWATIKKSFPPRTHLEEMKGTPRESFIYCTKEDKNYYQWGDEPKPGKRNDLINAVVAMRASSSLRDFVSDDENAAMLIRYTKGLITFRSLLQQPRNLDNPPQVYWLFGPTGAGKTKHAWDFLEKYFGTTNETWISNGSLRWFDGYDGHKGAILDDIRIDSKPYNELLRLLDRYPLRVEYKGGTTEWNPEIIIITAPTPPEYFFRPGDDIEQLLRRVNRVLEYKLTGPNPNLAELVLTVPNTPTSVCETEPEASTSCMFDMSSSPVPLLFGGLRGSSDIGSDLDDTEEEEEEIRPMNKKRKCIDLNQ